MSNDNAHQASKAEVDAFLARLSAKSRTAIDRYLAACDETNAAHAAVWRRLATVLAKLAPDAVETVGQAAVQFFVADGKYRMQVYALEDLRDGNLSIYTNDVVGRATEAGLLKAPSEEEPTLYRIKGGGGKQTLRIETLTAANTGSAPNYYRHMLGWNRKAIRIILSTSFCTPEQLSAVETLCQLAAPKPADPSKPAVAPQRKKGSTPAAETKATGPGSKAGSARTPF